MKSLVMVVLAAVFFIEPAFLDGPFQKPEAVTRAARLESGIDLIIRRLEQIEFRMNNWEELSEERWSRWDYLFSSMGGIDRIGSKTGGGDETIAAKMEGTMADTNAALEELFEKILRLEERVGHHERSVNQQLERLTSMALSGLEMMASIRTENSMDFRRVVRVLNHLEVRTTALTSKIDSNVASFPRYRANRTITSFDQLSRKKLSEPHEAVSRKRLQFPDEDLRAVLEVAPRRNKQNASPKSLLAELAQGVGLSRAIPTSSENAVMDDANTSNAENKTKKSTPASSRSPGEQKANAAKREGDLNETGESVTDTEAIQKRLQKIAQQEMYTLSNKLANMYEELWRQGKSVEDIVSNISSLVQTMKWDMDDGFRLIIARSSSASPCRDSPLLDPPEATALSAMKGLASLPKRLNNLDERLDIFAEALQNLQSQAIHNREWESTITDVLEKLLDLVQNGSLAIQREMHELHSFVEHHNDKTVKLLLQVPAVGSTDEDSKISTNDVAASHIRLGDQKNFKVDSPDEDDEKQNFSDYPWTDNDDQLDVENNNKYESEDEKAAR